MSTTAYATSINELCERLDSLAQSVAAEFAQHQQRVDQLRQENEASDESVEIRGPVLASTYALLEAVEHLQGQIGDVRDIIAQQQLLLNSLHTESRTDALTGCLNRRAFDEEIARRQAETRRGGSPAGVIMFDIDDFKPVNDTQGHAAGDKVLKGVANVLVNTFRDMDLVARYGGEEFGVILPNTNLLNACRAAERARIAVARSIFLYDERELTVTVSAGVALFDAEQPDVVKRADNAMYAAKQAGRNRVFAYKDGYCQPLKQEATGEHGAQRRRWMRFLVEDFTVQMRRPGQPWQVAKVHDESLTGIGLIATADVSVAVDDLIEINYCDELRIAQVMFVGADAENSEAVRLGLRWENDQL